MLMMMMIKSKIDIVVDNGGGFEEICSLLRNRGLTSSCGSLSWQVTTIFIITNTSIAVISHLSDHGWAWTSPQDAWRNGTEVAFYII